MKSRDSASPSDVSAGSGESSQKTKKIRFSDPDITVTVGSGNNMKSYETYASLLAFSSEYFDTMLSSGLRESTEMQISFPEDDPKDWELLYAFLDPATARSQKIDAKNARQLAPWFHKLMMKDHLKECDNVLAKKYEKVINYCFWSNRTEEKRAQREKKLGEIVSLYSYSRNLGLDKTKLQCAGDFFNAVEDAYDTLDVDTLSRIVPLLEIENGRQKPLRLWRALEKFLPKGLKLLGDSPGIAKDNPLLSHVIRQGIESSLMKQELQNKVKTLKIEVDYVWKRMPQDVYRKLPERKSTNNQYRIDDLGEKAVKEVIRNRWKDKPFVDLPQDYLSRA